MKGGRLRVANETSYPGNEVRPLVEYGLQDLDIRGYGITVLIKPTKRGKSRRDGRGVIHPGRTISYSGEFHDFTRGIPVGLVEKMARRDSALIIVRVGPPHAFPVSKSFRWYDTGFWTWQEAIMAVSAHEGAHAQHYFDNAYRERTLVQRRGPDGKPRTVRRRIGVQRIEPKCEAVEHATLMRYRAEVLVDQHGNPLWPDVEVRAPARNT